MDNKAFNQVLSQWIKSTIGVLPKKLSYYIEALTHRSYSNEHKLNYSYQRLEFLGDSVLGFLAAEYLFNKYPDKDEGFLTVYRKRLVQSATEVALAKQIGLQNMLLLGKGAKNFSSIDKILEDGFEAFLGAIYLDHGIDRVRLFLNKTLFKFEDQVILDQALDYKTLVQEALVKHNTKHALYNTSQLADGTFKSKLTANGITYGVGSGHNKKAAETAAAKDAYSKLIIK